MQDISEITEVNIENTCRTCLFQCSELNSLFDVVGTSELSLAEILMAFTQVQILQDDNFPSRICNECTNQVINSYNFKVKAEQNEKLLLNFLNEKKKKHSTAPDSIENNEKDLMITIKVEADRLFEQKILKQDAALNQGKKEESECEVQQYKIGDEFCESIQDEDFHSESETKVAPPIANDGDFRCDFHDASMKQEGMISGQSKTTEEANIQECKVYDETPGNADQLKIPMEQHSKMKVFDCSECSEKFESKLRLKVHRSTIHTNKKRRKQIAEELKSEEEALKVEFSEIDSSLCMPNGQKTIQCKICDKNFNKIHLLRDHLELHKSFENINFAHCELIKAQSSRNEANFNDIVTQVMEDLEHGRLSRFYSIVNQSGNELGLSDSETESDNDDFGHRRHRLYVCEVCDKNFDRKYKALYHQKSSHSYDELNHECCNCRKRFISKDLLGDHLRAQCENLEKQVTCEECNMKFMWHENLMLHSNIQHSSSSRKVKKKDQPREKSFVCNICDKSFYRQEHLDRHANIHQPEEKKFECPTCHKKFNRKDNMKSHMKIHREGKDKDDIDKHLCVYCGRSFSNSSNLIVHMRRHTGEKPYKCDLCDKGFPRSSDLQCHRRTHTGEKPCLCTICGKGFSRSNKLARHMRIHTGVRPYKCTYCDRAFTQSNDLTLHIRRHTGDKPYVCGICGERFIQGTALHTHRRLKGHFEEGVQEAPYSSISVNNPNRMNFANRVDRIGIPKNTTNRNPIEIKPVGRGNTRTTFLKNADKPEDVVQSAAVANSLSNGVSTALEDRNLSLPNPNETVTVKNISNCIQPTIPISSNSAFLTSTNVPYVQLEDGDFFAITNLGYQTYH